jgi:hypothetical protein
VVSGGRHIGSSTAAGIFGPERAVSTPTLTAAAGSWIREAQAGRRGAPALVELSWNLKMRGFNRWRKWRSSAPARL